ncbi:MAG: hypothetical protein AABZ64_15090 [Nitrospinota bacterium]
MQPRGLGLLAIFCDLESRWHQEFRAWLAEEMFPARLDIGFCCCASYDLVPGEGDDRSSFAPPFLTLYETPALADLYGEPYAALRRDRGERDRAFHQRMLGVERYTLAAGGLPPAGGEPGLGPLAFVDRFDLRPAEVDGFNGWFEAEYAPWCAKVPGCIRVRRYLAMEGAPRHFVLHEFGSEAFLDHSLWRALRHEEHWSPTAMTHGSPALYRRAVQAP